jgi:hypothetical protein
VALLPFSAFTLVVAVGSTGWRRYVAQKRLIQIGLVLIGIGVLLLTQRTAPDLTISEMILPMAIIGVGLGLFTGQLVDLTMSAVPEAFSEVSSGVINSLSQLGTGNVLDHEYRMMRDGERIAEVSKEWFRVRDSYGIAVSPKMDAGLAVACTVAVDMMVNPTRRPGSRMGD